MQYYDDIPINLPYLIYIIAVVTDDSNYNIFIILISIH